MRTLAISKKVLKELLRDKRTLAMMFIAPIMIMWLVSIMFSATTTTSARIAAVHVDTDLVTSLDKIKHISVKEYTNKTAAKKALDKQKVDAILVKNQNRYSITYANTDASKTALTRQAVKPLLTSSQNQQILEKIKKAAAANPSLSKLLVNTSQTSSKIKEYYNYGDSNTDFFTKIIPIIMGFIVFFFVFLISGMALLNERTTGTLERLLATPVKRSDLVFGYMISYGILAIIQTVVIVFSTIWLLDIEVVGNIANVILVNFILALVALSFGILLSTFAKSEFQMMQFIPVVVLPQIFFSGIVPLEGMGSWGQAIGKILPLSYSGEALTKIVMYGKGITDISFDILILLVFLILLTIANIIGLKRYRKV
ncbi:ABC transporter permease [Streptococcus dentiloxodontae]